MRLKWRIESPGDCRQLQASSAAGTWHNKVGSLAVPAGLLRVEYVAEMEETLDRQGALDVFNDLSKAANSEVSKEASTKAGSISSIAFKGSEEKTRVRAACVFVIVVLARGSASRTIGVDKSLRVILFSYKILLISMPNECHLFIPQIHLTIAFNNPVQGYRYHSMNIR